VKSTAKKTLRMALPLVCMILQAPPPLVQLWQAETFHILIKVMVMNSA
jgi:hypothetical protein